MTKKALIIGATGAIGQTLTLQLLACDQIDQVVTFTRTPQSITHPKFVNHQIDFDDLNINRHLIKGEYLFSCLGTTKKQAGSINAQRMVDLTYQNNVAQIAIENNVNHVLLVSSSGANASSNNAYLQMKGELEEKIKAMGFNQLSIIQPSLLIAKRQPLRVGESIGNTLLPLLCQFPFLRKYRPIKVEQVAKKLIEIALNQGSSQQTYSLDTLHD